MDYKSFLHLAIASGLLKQSDLVTMREDFAEVRNRGTTDAERLSLVTTYFIERRTLTPWQCEKLANGSYKGFFLGKYKLLDHLGHTQASGRYLAEDTQSREMVEVSVDPMGQRIRLSIIRETKVIETTIIDRDK